MMLYNITQILQCNGEIFVFLLNESELGRSVIIIM